MRFNALWWWIDRWRKSTAYTDMTLEEQGAYRNLLDEATLRGGALPRDERILAKACGDALKWKTVRKAVLARFEVRGDALHNRTLDAVLRESYMRAERQARYRTKRNASGNDDGKDDSNGEGNEGDNGEGNGPGNKSPYPDPYPDPLQGPEPTNAPPFPPARNARRGAPRRATGDLEAAVEYIASKNGRAYRDTRRRLRDWFKAGCSLDEVKARIDAGEHHRRPPL